MKQNKKVELLAPAGNMEAFYGAIHAGADAVYLGGSKFGARAYADNFTEEELISCIRYAHLWGRKVYLTVNTLMKETEFNELYDYLCPYYEAGLDGVIIQDIGVFAFVRQQFPGMELHVSTQMTITGKYGARLLKDMGASRVVPARELSLTEIIEMKEATGLEIECFIHGAMCYCYSGQCLFSSILGGRSGNRGRCAQPCRLPYRVQNKAAVTKECYPLSLKDMCTIEHIPELIEAGIDSFKIEGRMKKAEYAAGVTAIYRKYIDQYYQTPNKPFRVAKEDLEKLSTLYIRSERQNGYYHKHNDKDMVTLSQPSYCGNNESLLKEIRSVYLEQSPKLPVAIYGSFQVGEPAKVSFFMNDLSVTVTGSEVQKAQKQPISRENVEKQLKKLGDSSFCMESIDIDLDEEAFYSLKEMNELRRQAVVQLEKQVIQKHGLLFERKAIQRKVAEQSVLLRSLNQGKEKEPENHLPIISVRTMEQLYAVCQYTAKNKIRRIYLDGDLFLHWDALFPQLNRIVKNCDCEMIITLPYILRSRDSVYLERVFEIACRHNDLIDGFQVRGPEGLGFLKEKEYKGRIYADTGFYVWNQKTIDVLSKELDGFCIPYELKTSEQKSLLCDYAFNTALSIEKVFYGRIPMMVTANCVIRTTDVCSNGREKPEQVYLIDRYQKKLPVIVNCEHCMNIIYNSVPLSLHKDYVQWHQWYPQTGVRLNFTVEGREETADILAFFQSVLLEENKESEKPPYKDYTTGHEKRGVE